MPFPPKTHWELEHRFSSEMACRQYLFELRWPNGFVCPHCSHQKAWRQKNGLLRCAHCDRRTSVTSGTLLEGTRKPLLFWFKAIWSLSGQKQGVNACELQRILKFGSYETAWAWMHKLRRAMVHCGRGGLSGRVEVDEAYLGNAMDSMRPDSNLICIAVQLRQNRIGRIRLKPLEDGSAASLESALQRMVKPDSEVMTDGWKGYAQLAGLGYRHNIVRQESHMGNNLLPACQHVCSALRQWLATAYRGVATSVHLATYLEEFVFHHNNGRFSNRGRNFQRLLLHVLTAESRPFPKIIESSG